MRGGGGLRGESEGGGCEEREGRGEGKVIFFVNVYCCHDN